MKTILLTLLFVWFYSGVANAQGVVWHVGDHNFGNRYSRSTMPRTTMIDYQKARKMSIENDQRRIRAGWGIKDEARRRRETRSRENRFKGWKNRMDNAEKRYELLQRENRLIEQGILPPRRKPEFMYINGKPYKTYAEYKASPAWVEMIKKSVDRWWQQEMEKRVAERRRLNAVRFEARRRQYSASTNYLMDLKRTNRRWVRRIIRDNPNVRQNYTVVRK